MFTKTITAAALAIGMSTAAFAQTSGAGEAQDPTVPGAGMPSGWDQTTTDAFFSDSSAGTLRSQDEIQANWGTLSDEQQAQVRSHCATMSADAGAGTGTTTTGDAQTTGDAGMTDDTQTGSTTGDTAAGATTNDAAGMTAGGQLAAMSELCSWVDRQ